MEYVSRYDRICRSPLRALGITDCFSIERYLQVREHQRQGLLPGVGLIFPKLDIASNQAFRPRLVVEVDGNTARASFEVHTGDHGLEGLPKEYPDHFEPTNYAHADRLRGKLMLAHGFVGDNVHVGITLQMADALIRANKDFDLFIHPSVNHQNFYRSGFTNRKPWNYFVEHLRNESPPTDVRVPDPQ